MGYDYPGSIRVVDRWGDLPDYADIINIRGVEFIQIDFAQSMSENKRRYRQDEIFKNVVNFFLDNHKNWKGKSMEEMVKGGTGAQIELDEYEEYVR